MGDSVRWAKMAGSRYSGPYARGTCSYALPPDPTGFDVIVAAVARPEGGNYDTVVMYDGTAVTYGLLQWTFTSGRLHKLLAATALALGETSSTWESFSQELYRLTTLKIDPSRGKLYLGGQPRMREVTNYFSLRDVCTPPEGACPKTGPNWEKAKAIALLFSKLGENSISQKAQIDFFREELKQAINVKRPQMANKTIASFLYPNGWEDDGPESTFAGPNELSRSRCLTAARALFWGMWQNSPAKAQSFLGKTAGFDLATQEGVERLAKLFAYTTFARWGVEKAKQAKKPYQSRYQKVATEINLAMRQKIVPEYWK